MARILNQLIGNVSLLIPFPFEWLIVYPWVYLMIGMCYNLFTLFFPRDLFNHIPTIMGIERWGNSKIDIINDFIKLYVQQCQKLLLEKHFDVDVSGIIIDFMGFDDSSLMVKPEQYSQLLKDIERSGLSSWKKSKETVNFTEYGYLDLNMIEILIQCDKMMVCSEISSYFWPIYMFSIWGQFLLHPIVEKVVLPILTVLI